MQSSALRIALHNGLANFTCTMIFKHACLLLADTQVTQPAANIATHLHQKRQSSCKVSCLVRCWYQVCLILQQVQGQASVQCSDTTAAHVPHRACVGCTELQYRLVRLSTPGQEHTTQTTHLHRSLVTIKKQKCVTIR